MVRALDDPDWTGQLTPNAIPAIAFRRAALVLLDACGTPPPPSLLPAVAQGTLVTAEEVLARYPKIRAADIEWSDMERVYLDMCSPKRPFDDQRQPRVREEAAAVAAIIGRADDGEIALVRSPAHLVETDANPREDRRLAAALWIDGAGIDIPIDAEVEVRAAALAASGFRPLDALHVAFADLAGARWFVTCDDALLKLAARLGDALQTLIVTPGSFVQEVSHESGGTPFEL